MMMTNSNSMSSMMKIHLSCREVRRATLAGGHRSERAGGQLYNGVAVAIAHRQRQLHILRMCNE